MLNSCNVEDNKKTENENNELICYFFFIPDCPASINNINKVNVLKEIYDDEVEFIGVLSEPEFNENNVDSILRLYSIRFDVLIDDSLNLAKKHKATVTPEFFLYANNDLVYSGAIDDYYFAIGKHKNTSSKNYLEDAIKACLSGSEIKIKSTDAFGCKIEINYFK